MHTPLLNLENDKKLENRGSLNQASNLLDNQIHIYVPSHELQDARAAGRQRFYKPRSGKRPLHGQILTEQQFRSLIIQSWRRYDIKRQRGIWAVDTQHQ